MLRTIRRLLSPPIFEHEDQNRAAWLLTRMLQIIFVTFIAVIFISEALDSDPGFTYPILAASVVSILTIYALVRRGRLRLAVVLSVAFLWVIFTATTALFQGVLGYFPAGYILCIILAGTLSGRKGILLATGVSILSVLGLLLAETTGLIHPVMSDASGIIDWIDLAFLFGLVAMFVMSTERSYRAALSSARQNELAQIEANRALQALRSSLEDRVQASTAQLRTSAEVSRVATSILDPNELMRQITNLITESFGFYYAAVFVLDQSEAYLILREATGEAGRTLKERRHRLSVGLDSMVGYAVVKREPRVALNAGEDAVRFANPLLPDTQSEIALPLMVSGQVLGALDVQSTQLNAFDDTIIATLQNVAAQIAIALQNAQSYQRLQETLNYTTSQYELSRTIFAARTTQEAYQSLGQVFALMSSVDRISMLRITDRDATGQPMEYELATQWDVLSGAQFDTGLRYTAAETPLAKLVAEDDLIVIQDAQDSRLPLSTREQLAQAGAQAVMLVPLMIRGQYEGFIAAVAEQPHDFQDSEIRLMQSAAEQFGVVLSNMQLTTEMQATLERVALLNRRLSGEAWSSYLAGRDQWVVESGQAQPASIPASLQVPIVVRGQTIGTFDVADASPDRQWHEEELTMLQTIAGEVALAIENARLIEQTQRTAQREKDIASAADKIHRSIDLEAILHTAVEEVMRITGTTEVAVQLGLDQHKAGGQQLASTGVKPLPEAKALVQP